MIEHYFKKFAKLNANKNRKHWTAVSTHRAPHKPLLLLSVMDLIAEGHLQQNFIELDDELLELFALYWRVVNPPTLRGDITMPFFHLQSEGFWHLLPQPGKGEILAAKRRADGLKQLRELVLGAKLDDALFDLLQVAETRGLLRATLIETYFHPDIHARLVEQGQTNQKAFLYSQTLLQQAKNEEIKDKGEDPYTVEKPVRDQGFRRAIVKAYDHRCAICGVRILTADGHTAIAAAHIIPWSISYDDDPRNGLALCHLCHWTFDEGLVAFSDSYQVKTSPQLMLTPNLPGHLLTFAGRRLIGPVDEAYWPFVESVRWHRRELFRRR